MEGEEIGLVLARASEIRSKLNHYIDLKNAAEDGAAHESNAEDEEVDDDAEENLVSIRDALESLERQIETLQNLQQQQRYERQASLAQIDRSRKLLLSKLKEYKGEELQVIHEAAVFAAEAIDRDDDLLLPPYPTHLPELFVLDNLYPSTHTPSKFSGNGLSGDHKHTMKKSFDELSEKPSAEHRNKSSSKGLGFVFGVITKSAIAFLGVISVMHMSGIKVTLRKGCYEFKLPNSLQKLETGERDAPFECPPGKVLVIENGKPRCLVKERVEIPFESKVTSPSVDYGFG